MSAHRHSQVKSMIAQCGGGEEESEDSALSYF